MSAVVGFIASLSCAATWALASIIFQSIMASGAASPWGVSLSKSIIALPALLGIVAALGLGLPHAGGRMGLLVASSVLGLVVADTAYLAGLKRLGVERGVMVIPLVPAATGVLASLMNDEVLGAVGVAGIVVTLVGVALALRVKAGGAGAASDGAVVVGVLVAAVYVGAQALSNVLLKRVLLDAEAAHVASLRLLVGIPIIALLTATVGGGAAGVVPLWRRETLPWVALASVVGTVGGMWLGSVGTKNLPVAVAAALAATTPIWALLFHRLRGGPMTWAAVFYAGIALGGVGLLAYNRFG